MRHQRFAAEAAGFSNLGLTADYSKELPFTGAVVNKNWAENNPVRLRKLASPCLSPCWPVQNEVIE